MEDLGIYPFSAYEEGTDDRSCDTMKVDVLLEAYK
jgi:hypothetical protein